MSKRAKTNDEIAAERLLRREQRNRAKNQRPQKPSVRAGASANGHKGRLRVPLIDAAADFKDGIVPGANLDTSEIASRHPIQGAKGDV